MAKQTNDRDMSAAPTDETLMAFVDGELDAGECRRVEQALERDPSLRDRLQAFERTGRGLGDLYAQPLNEPVPAHLLELVRGAELREREPGLLERLSDRLRASLADLAMPQPGWASAAAAAGVFAIGLSMGLWLQDRPSGPSADRYALLGIEDNHLWARGALQDALEGVASGSSKSWVVGSNGEGTVVPVLTFKDKTGRFCREYAVAGTPEASAIGIACRTAKDRWSIEIHTAQPTESVIRPASGGGIERLQALMSEMSAGEPLDLDQEESAIRKGWR